MWCVLLLSSQPTSQWLVRFGLLAVVRQSGGAFLDYRLVSRSAPTDAANSLAACVRSGDGNDDLVRKMGFHNWPLSQQVTPSDIFLSDDTTNLAATAISSSRCTQFPPPPFTPPPPPGCLFSLPPTAPANPIRPSGRPVFRFQLCPLNAFAFPHKKNKNKTKRK